MCPAVFKTVAGGEELPRWVRFPHTLANGNRSGSAAPVFVHFNPSVKPSVCQLPGRGAFWCSIVSYMNTGTHCVPSSSQSLTLARRKADFTWRSHISLRFGAISPVRKNGFHCGRKPAYIVPVTTTVVTPGVTLTTPVVVSCVNVAAGTVSVVAAPVSGRVSTPAV